MLGPEPYSRLLPPQFVAEIGDPRQQAAELLDVESALVERAVAHRRREFEMGRQCARRALHRLGVTQFPLLIGHSREPLWPHGIVGSITHTDIFCGAVVGSTALFRGVGIDAEPAEPVEARLAQRIATEHEITRLRLFEPALSATLLFSAKESIYKCQFQCTNTWLNFRDVAVEVEADGTFAASLLVDAGSIAKGTIIPGRWLHEGQLFLTAAWLMC